MTLKLGINLTWLAIEFFWFLSRFLFLFVACLSPDQIKLEEKKGQLSLLSFSLLVPDNGEKVS